MDMNYELYWKLWACVSLLGFAIPEAITLYAKDGNTLSHWVMRWFNSGIDGWSWEKTLLLLICLVAVGVAVWLIPHWIKF